MTDDDLAEDLDLGRDGPRHRLEADRLEDSLRTMRLRDPVVVSRGARLAKVIRRMRKAGVGSCLITDDADRLVGIFTERDLLNKASLRSVDLDKVKVDEMMQSDPETLTLDHPIAYALNRMAGGSYRNIPLIDRGGQVTGLVTLRRRRRVGAEEDVVGRGAATRNPTQRCRSRDVRRSVDRARRTGPAG